jgi:hypothetical protein
MTTHLNINEILLKAEGKAVSLVHEKNTSYIVMNRRNDPYDYDFLIALSKCLDQV